MPFPRHAIKPICFVLPALILANIFVPYFSSSSETRMGVFSEAFNAFIRKCLRRQY